MFPGFCRISVDGENFKNEESALKKETTIYWMLRKSQFGGKKRSCFV